MNRQMVLASALATAAAGLAYIYLGAKEAAIKAEVTPWYVLVAKRSVGPGGVLDADNVTIKEIPAAYVMPGALASASPGVLRAQWKKYQGQTALAPVAKGEHILPNKFSPIPPGFAAVVPGGLRSTAFNLEPAAANGGHLRPGNHVDVLAAFLGPGAKRPTMVMLAQNVRILAVGALNGWDKDKSRSEALGSVSGLDVCLALTPKDALRLCLAEKEGSLKLALRAPGDEQELDPRPQNLDTVLGPLLAGE